MDVAQFAYAEDVRVAGVDGTKGGWVAIVLEDSRFASDLVLQPGNRKKSAGGALERLRLLGRHGIELNGLSFAASASLNDVLDASAAAWSADRIARSQARTLPDPPESVAGLAVAIWY